MNGGRTDASTSTDDIKGRPLCLFYFTHPFGVLSPEPPCVAAAPPHVARTFVNMQPAPPSAFRCSPDSDCDYGTSSASRPSDLDPTLHRNPVDSLRNYTLDFTRRDSVSSSLFSSDVWFGSSASSKNYGSERRLIPYKRILPPLRLPAPRDLAWNGCDDVWPEKCMTREKFSLPPIELPGSAAGVSGASEMDRVVSECESGTVHVVRCRRALVARHRRRARLSGVQRMVTCLVKRTVKGDILMGYIFDNCPTQHECCWGVPLRPAVVTIAVVGLLWACVYFFGFTSPGAKAAEDLGLSDDIGKVMRYIHGIFGILLFAVNLLLLAAAVYESDSLCEVYLWFMVVFWVVMVTSSMAVAISAMVSGKFAFAGVYLLVMCCAALMTIYFTIIVGNYRMTLP